MSNFSKEKLNDLVVLLMSFLGHDHTVLPSKNKKVVAHFPFTLVVPALLFNLLFFCVFIAGCHWQAKNEQGDRVKKKSTSKTVDNFLTFEDEIWELFKKIEKSPDEEQQAAFREQIWQLADRYTRQNKK